MIDAGLITPWELLKTLCTGTAVSELKQILFKASRKTFEFIQADFNKWIYLTDKSSDEFKAWKAKKQKRKMDRQGYSVTA